MNSLGILFMAPGIGQDACPGSSMAAARSTQPRFNVTDLRVAAQHACLSAGPGRLNAGEKALAHIPPNDSFKTGAGGERSPSMDAQGRPGRSFKREPAGTSRLVARRTPGEGRTDRRLTVGVARDGGLLACRRTPRRTEEAILMRHEVPMFKVPRARTRRLARAKPDQWPTTRRQTGPRCLYAWQRAGRFEADLTVTRMAQDRFMA